MKRTAIAGLVLALAAVPALAADEEWLVYGGDGGAYGYDRASVVVSSTGVTSVQHAVFNAASQTIGKDLYNGLIGELIVDCKARTAYPGATQLFSLAGEIQQLPAPPETKPAPIGTGNPRAAIADAVCNGKKGPDPHLAIGRVQAVAILRAVTLKAHVKADANKGWALASYTPAALFAIDTSQTKRTGDIARQTEITWMRKDQTANGQAWRYNQVQVEYNCAAKTRRGTGKLQIFAADNKLVHEETVADQAWTPLPPGSAMLEVACNGAKLAGLPVGAREAMIVRLRELGVLM